MKVYIDIFSCAYSKLNLHFSSQRLLKSQASNRDGEKYPPRQDGVASHQISTVPGRSPLVDPVEFCRKWIQQHHEAKQSQSQSMASRHARTGYDTADPSRKAQQNANHSHSHSHGRSRSHHMRTPSSSAEQDVTDTSSIPFDTLFSDVPSSVAPSKASDDTADSALTTMSLGMMSPEFTPMSIPNGTIGNINSCEINFLDNCFMHEGLNDFIAEDLFAWQTPSTAREQHCVSRNPEEFTPLLTHSSFDSYINSRIATDGGTDSYSYTIQNIDCSPILGNESYASQSIAMLQVPASLVVPTAARGRSSTRGPVKDPPAVEFKDGEDRAALEQNMHSADNSSNPIEVAATSPSEQNHLFETIPAYHPEERTPDSLAMLCTELYTKILSDESGCIADDAEGNLILAGSVNGISENTTRNDSSLAGLEACCDKRIEGEGSNENVSFQELKHKAVKRRTTVRSAILKTANSVGKEDARFDDSIFTNDAEMEEGIASLEEKYLVL